MDIEKEIHAIRERNANVEADKAWETSWTRRSFIALASYCIAGVWLVLIEDSLPWLKAFVPAAGYILSTFSLVFLRDRWKKRRNA